MQTRVLLGLGTGLAALASLPGYSQSSNAAALEAACRATEVTMPDSCPCTITKARAAGLDDTELASLFKDDGHTDPIDQRKYGLFWQVKSQCIADAMMASMGISAANPLPGVPEHMRPKMPGTAPTPPSASPPSNTPPLPDAPRTQEPSDLSSKRTLADISAMIAQLRDSAWEYTDENGRFHRYDFLPEGDLVVYQQREASTDGSRFAQVLQLSAAENQYDAFIRTRDVTSGQFGDLPIKSLTQSVLNYQKRYVRNEEDWLFRRVGPASQTLPDTAPRRLEDGFWQIEFTRVSKNPLNLGRNRLQGLANAANRTINTAPIAGAFTSAFLIADVASEDCNSSCFFVVNDFDRRARSVSRRLIEEAGVDFVGLRAEASTGPYNIVSIRVFDGYGGFKQWRCTDQDSLQFDCSPTASRKPAQTALAAATAGTQGVLARLGPVKGESWGDAGCSGDLYRFPADGRMPQDITALFAHTRSQTAAHIGTQVSVDRDLVGYKLNIDGRDIILPPGNGTDLYSNADVSLQTRNIGEGINDPNEPSFSFQQMKADITINGESASLDAIFLGAC